MTTSATLPAAGGTTGAPSGGPLRIPAAGVEQHVEHQRHVLLWQARGAAEVRLTTESSVQTVPGAVMGVVTVYEGQALWIPVRTSHELRVHPDSVTVPLGFEAADWGTILREPTLLTVDRDLQHLMLAQHVTSSSAISSAADITRQLLALIEKAPMVSEDLPMPPDGPAGGRAAALRPRGHPQRGGAGSDQRALRAERAFLRDTGTTLRQWRIRCRMDAAQTLLHGQEPVSAVARRVGYSHVNAFRRAFAREVGLAPGEYRRQALGHS